MKPVRYTADAARDLRRHGRMAGRVRAAIAEYAAGGGAHANNVKALRASSAKRLRVGDFRAVFEETPDAILVTKVGPRGDVYD